jgi:DNA repair exonuclease SbcCD ATPase subunit
MFNPNTSTDTKLAVLEERLSAYEMLLKKIDEAIQMMGKTSQNISKMLAVHEEKIEQCSKNDDSILTIIHELKEENRQQHLEVEKRIDGMETEVKEISKIKWMTVGCGVILAILTASVASLASGWWTPSEIQLQRQEVLDRIIRELDRGK